MHVDPTPTHQPPAAVTGGPFSRLFGLYRRTPLPARIVMALVLGGLVGSLLTPDQAKRLHPISDLILKLLGALATPLIFISVVHSLMGTRLSGRKPLALFAILMLNTTVAILIGLMVANLIQPGQRTEAVPFEGRELPKQRSLVEDLLGKVPGSLLRPFVENDILGVILIALAIGVGLRIVREQQLQHGQTGYLTVENLLTVGSRVVMLLLHGVFELVPLAVFAVVARMVGTTGFQAFAALGWFVVAVLIALSLQAAYYMTLLWVGGRVSPLRFLRGGADAFLTAFSTASSAATLPITFACAREKLNVSEETASLGVMVGGTFNHDGTALYEAMAALFVSQLIGQHLGLEQQAHLVLLAVFASVGAAGIPEAGLVTMMAVFTAVGLPVEYIPLLLTVDWFLDRCRTAINVMGDLSVTCLLDAARVRSGVRPEAELAAEGAAWAPEGAEKKWWDGKQNGIKEKAP